MWVPTGCPTVAGCQDVQDLLGRSGEGLQRTSLDLITTTDLRVVANEVELAAKAKGGHGRSAAEHFVSACRCFFRVAVEYGLLLNSPAGKLEKPRRLKGRRRMLTEPELQEFWLVVETGSDDPSLDEVAAYPIGVGTDVLKLVARQILGLDEPRHRGDP